MKLYISSFLHCLLLGSSITGTLYALDQQAQTNQKVPTLTFPVEFPSGNSAIYMNTKCLRNPHLMKQQMLTDGFQEGYFKTDDNVALNYLYLERPHAEYSIIFATGFMPGHKEGLASFFTLLPDNCNLLYFDARGHGTSEGKFLSNIWKYGHQEYRDIIGAIKFVASKSNKPIYLYGNCAGAFHSAHALIRLKKQRKLHKYPIKGLIFDSGWGSVTSVSWSAPQAHIDTMLAKSLGKTFNTRHDHIKRSFIYQCISNIISAGLYLIRALFFWPFFASCEHKTNLFDKIHHIKVPILFIHSYDDEYAPIKHAKELSTKVKNKICWWISQPSKHACHHIKYAQAYRDTVIRFIQNTLTPGLVSA